MWLDFGRMKLSGIPDMKVYVKQWEKREIIEEFHTRFESGSRIYRKRGRQ